MLKSKLPFASERVISPVEAMETVALGMGELVPFSKMVPDGWAVVSVTASVIIKRTGRQGEGATGRRSWEWELTQRRGDTETRRKKERTM